MTSPGLWRVKTLGYKIPAAQVRNLEPKWLQSSIDKINYLKVNRARLRKDLRKVYLKINRKVHARFLRKARARPAQGHARSAQGPRKTRARTAQDPRKTRARTAQDPRRKTAAEDKTLSRLKHQRLAPSTSSSTLEVGCAQKVSLRFFLIEIEWCQVMMKIDDEQTCLRSKHTSRSCAKNAYNK